MSMPRNSKTCRWRLRRTVALIGSVSLVCVTTGGTCVAVEEEPPGAFEEPGIDEERMEEQEYEVMEEEDR
jgi:hypothetical protein